MLAGDGYSLQMSASGEGWPFMVKVINICHGNRHRALPSHVGTVTLFDRETGVPFALLDAAAVTAVRTAATAALSVALCARPDARIATIVGTGVQARAHLQWLLQVRPFETVNIVGRSEATLAAFAPRLPRDPRLVLTTDARKAVMSSDVICLTTSSAQPCIDAEWVPLNAHVTSVGFAPPGSELPTALVHDSIVIVESMDALLPAPIGAVELQGLPAAQVTSLGQWLQSQDAIPRDHGRRTLYKSMGLALEDLVTVTHIWGNLQDRPS
jgi:alanine dehydrogenase